MSSLFQVSLQQKTQSIISTSADDLKRKQIHDSRSYAAKTLELQFGFIIEDYIAKGKDRLDTYIEEHRRFCAEFIQKEQSKRGNSHKMKEIKVQHRIWTLLLHLFNSKKSKNKACTDSDNNEYYFNPKAFVTDKFNADYKLRKLEHVILWLQDIAESPFYLKKGNISYSHTLLKDTNDTHLSLDPDHSTDNIDTQDMNDEEKLLNIVFKLIRKGRWSEACNVCRAYGCHYRAVSINGRRLFSDECSVSNGIHSINGNEEYLMWLKVCNAICVNAQSVYERWIYATLCGNKEQLLTLCESESENNRENWYDLLWILAVCKNIEIQKHLLTDSLPSHYHNTLKREKIKMGSHNSLGMNEWSFNAIFDFIETKVFNKDIIENNKNYLNFAYNYEYYKICKFLVCEEYDLLLQNCMEFVQRMATKNEITLDFMRFVIHLYLHLNPQISTIEQHKRSLLFEEFIKIYVKQLQNCENYEQIARYCYILPKQELISTLTDFYLTFSKDYKLRSQLLYKATQILPIDIIQCITVNIAKSVIDTSVINSQSLQWKQISVIQNAISVSDEQKIDSLTCLKMVKSENNNEILFKTNQLFVMFAKEYKLNAIAKLFGNVCNAIDTIHSKDAMVDTHLNTYQCFGYYKRVIDAYNIWREYPNNHNGIDLVMNSAHTMLCYKNGWLNPKYCSVQQLSFNEMNEIRCVCLRRLLQMLYAFVNETSQFGFCLSLVTIFANERYAYYKLFEGGKNVIKELINQAKNAKIEQIYQFQQSSN